ncbi:HAD-IIB family hydrolase [soil metagenome]
MEKIKLVAFDIDQTLTVSKSQIDDVMAGLLGELLHYKKVAIISGGAFKQFKKQIVDHLDVPPEFLRNLYLLPTNGTSLYEYNEEWIEVYKNNLSIDEKNKILEAFKEAFKATGFIEPEKIYGVQLEDRETQITFSGLGSEAPIELKKSWDPDHTKRLALVGYLEQTLPQFSFGIGGETSIDVTAKGINKSYGMQQIMKYLNLDTDQILYIGDAFFKGGNDASIIPLHIKYISEAAPGLEDTKETIKELVTHCKSVV